ncbi:PhnA-like protein [Bradyrhizobium sp. SYSU BS000235]|uniref:PhnA-like protein n=1 Tax=Bradyrhizobium sp. SYSU BS000235 TaxID=3411332 RepID=UPI003C718146
MTSVPSDRDTRRVSAVSASDDIRTIMVHEISWGAVFAGAVMALVLQLILNMIGLGIGLGTVDATARGTPSASTLSMGAGLWWIISGVIASAVGGYIAGRLSGKPSDSTTAYHGLIAWAVATLIVVYLVSSAAANMFGGAFNSVSSAMGGAGKAASETVQTAVQSVAPSLDSVGDPFSRIENQIRSAAGGQDPAALRDAATSAMRAVITDDPSQQAAARERAAEAFAKAQNISSDEAKARVNQLEKQYTEAVARAKETARQAADKTASAVSRGALFGAIALLLGALAAYFAGRASAVNPTVTGSLGARARM